MLQGDPSASDRVGLALSGGGFRASLYHLGVLARLADEDRLREVEVLSAVSGGSVTAALYALHVRRLLEDKADADITREDYQDVVWRVGHDLRRAVRRNLRMRLFANPVKTVRMLSPRYSRSDRMAELYQKHLYKGLGGRDPVRLSDLLVRPPGHERALDFDPTDDNPHRSAKVPVTLLNATTLNSGHNWRFEGVRMGEPGAHAGSLGEIHARVDKNLRLQRVPLDPPEGEPPVDGPRRHGDLELAHGVAASTAVPGVFTPLSLSGLYPGVRVQLVDGGVHDNQGVQGLLDRGCRTFWVSDASGLMGDQRHPRNNLLDVLSRSNSIMGDRMREGQLVDLLEENGHSVALVHLLRGTVPAEVAYLPREGAAAASEAPEATEQRALAGIRTDLDAFHDAEAYSLARNGYDAIGGELRPGAAPPAGHADWPFLRVTAVPERRRLRLLRLGSRKGGKVLRASPVGALAAATVALALLAAYGAAGWFAWDALDRPVPSWTEALAGVGVAALYTAALLGVHRFAPPRSVWTYLRAVFHLPVVLLGVVFLWPVTNLYLWTLNGRYLRAGAVPGGDWPEDPSAASASAGTARASAASS